MYRVLGSYSLLLLAAGAGCSPRKPSAPAQQQVALVNGESIDKGTFDEAVARNLRRFGDSAKHLQPTMHGRIQESVLKQMVEERLVAQKADALDLRVSEQELDQTLATHRDRFGSAAAYRDYLSRANSTEASLREDLRKSLLTDRIIDKLGGAVEVGHDEIAKQYSENAEHYMQPERMRLHRLWLPYPTNPSNKARREVMARARDLARRADKVSFEALCRRYSKAPEAERGGDMGLVLAGRFVELDRAIAGGMQPGELSAPISVDDGVALFRLDEHQPRGQKPLAEVEGSIRTMLTIKKRNERRQQVLRSLHGDAQVRTLVAFDTGVTAPAPAAVGSRQPLPGSSGGLRK